MILGNGVLHKCGPNPVLSPHKWWQVSTPSSMVQCCNVLILDSNMHGHALCPCCHIPSQPCPSVFSVYPVSHEQVYEPIALLQVC